jgi:hypothetical protein
MSQSAEAPIQKSKSSRLDTIMEKLISRKLLVFLTATGLMSNALLDSETWGMIAIVYIGSQAAVDAMKIFRHGA